VVFAYGIDGQDLTILPEKLVISHTSNIDAIVIIRSQYLPLEYIKGGDCAIR
jgi:hypothetical protein